MTIDKFMARYPGAEVTPEQAACCRYLAGLGERFLIDFGYENAPQKTWERIDPKGDRNSDFDYDLTALATYRAIVFGKECLE